MAKLSLMIEGQEGLDWETWRHLCEISEELGFDSLWRSDHLISLMGDPARDCVECWTSLTMAAVWTKRLTFGPNVSPQTFREPGVLAKQAAAVDILSGGRLMLGIGAGWNENEHEVFHVPFLTLKERMDRMERSLEIIEEVWAASNPKPPRDGKVPFLIGGGGEKRTLKMAARYATLWSIGMMPPLDDYRHKVDVLAEHCAAIGRDPKTIRRGIQTTFLIGRNATEIRQRVQALKKRVPRLGSLSDDEVVTVMRERNFCGTPEEIAAKMRSYQELGVDLWMLQHFDWRDDDTLRLLMSDLAPLIA